jgi:aspartate/methionine/tyrosine aminotransferase
MVRALDEIDGVTCRTPRGAFYLFPNVSGVCRRLGIFDAHNDLPEAVRRRVAPSTLFQLFLLHEYQVATLDRRSFGVLGSDGEHYLRISIATAMEDLREAVARIARAAADLDGFRRFMKEERYV